MKRERFQWAGETVKIRPGVKGPNGTDLGGIDYEIEDWWENVFGRSWMCANGNPAAMHYAVRSAVNHLPFDNEVLYGKIGAGGYLMHVSELELPEEDGIDGK